MRLTSVQLAAFACLYDVLGIFFGGEPVETLAEIFGYNGPSESMMPAGANMYVFQNFLAFFWLYAPLIDVARASLI